MAVRLMKSGFIKVMGGSAVYTYMEFYEEAPPIGWAFCVNVIS
jgi:hypothetical protein